jgi:hypothetical protein
MALQEASGLLDIHTNMVATISPEISQSLISGKKPAYLSDDEHRAWDQLRRWLVTSQ